jgi:predicted outer membrane repeat protein
MDGDTYTVSVAGTLVERNQANEGGGAIFFVSNDRTGAMSIYWSTLRHNRNDVFHTDGLPGIFFLGAHRPRIRHSVLR